MKTIKNFMLVAFAATSIVACQKEEAQNNDLAPKGEVVTFTGSVNSAETKTAIWYTEEGATFPTLFTSADKIAVNGVISKADILDDATGNSEYKEGVSPSKDQTCITFDVEGVTPPYYAVTGTHSKGYADGVYNIQVAGTGAQQKFRTVAGGEYVSFWTSADILAAYSETESFEFKHMSTFYAITIDSENSTVNDNIKNIYVRQGDGSYIAGQWILKFEGEDHTPVLAPEKLTAYIGYDCLEDGIAQGTTMIIGLPAYDYESGLIFTIKDVNGKFASYKVAAEKTQHAADGGKIIPFKPAFKPGDGVINSAADWNEFAAFVNNTNEKKDWEIYRWIGAGGNTITLGKDIEAEDLDPITVDFTYTLDGNGKTITRTNAKKALFTSVSGTVKNLTLAGNFEATASQGDAPFVSTLAPGGTISGCTNKMTVTFEKADHAYVAGIVKMMTGGTIENCINDGTISAKLINTSDKNVAVAGIVAQVNASGQDIVIKDCLNKQAVTFAPVVESSSYGSKVCGVGGVAGWLRAASSFTLENCDNEGAVTYSAEFITSANGSKAYPICVGGVAGIAAAQNTAGYIEDPSEVGGLTISMTDCDNSGPVYNCGSVYLSSSTTNKKEIKKRVFTGGLVGSLTGKSDRYASLVSCTNTGSVTPYDKTGDGASTQACYTSVVGGLIGFGGYINMDKCTVNCAVGTNKRAVMAWGGVIGTTVEPFSLSNSNVYVTGFFQRIGNYGGNRAIVATVPYLFGTTASNTMSIVPDVSGSTITNCNIGGEVKTSTSTLSTANGEKTDDISSGDWAATLFKSESNTKDNLVCGQGFTANTGVTITGYTYWEGN